MVRYPLTMLGSSSKTIATSEHQDYQGKHPVHLQLLRTHTITLLFTFNTVFNKLHEAFNTLLLNRLVLDEFAQLQVNVGLFQWLSGKESTCQCRRPGFNPSVRKIPWRRKWKPTPVFLLGKLHGQRSLVSYSPWGYKSVRYLATKTTTTTKANVKCSEHV